MNIFLTIILLRNILLSMFVMDFFSLLLRAHHDLFIKRINNKQYFYSFAFSKIKN